MKKVFHFFSVAMVALTMIAFASCDGSEGKTPDQPNTDLPVIESLAGTEWEGSFSTTTMTPQGSMPVIMRWTLDFRENGSMPVMLVMDSPAFDDNAFDLPAKYTYDGKGHGYMTSLVEYFDNSDFTVDAINKTITMSCVVRFQHEEGGQEYAYGGETVFHQVR